jgi:hypothetical protein
LRANLATLFADFGEERVTESSHLEKVCLVRDGVGRDNISDFTVNLILDFICRYTQEFASLHIDPSVRKTVWVKKAIFNYNTESWERRSYDLPSMNGDFVLLTPKDILTRDENWINRTDMIPISIAFLLPFPTRNYVGRSSITFNPYSRGHRYVLPVGGNALPVRRTATRLPRAR